MFRDAGVVAARRDAPEVDAAAPAAAAADEQKQPPSQGSKAAAAMPSPKQAAPLPDSAQIKTEDEPAVKQETQSPHSQMQMQTQTQTQTQARPAYQNYNCGPTSTVPVWRLQTAEEQAELLQLEKAAETGGAAARVKAEIDELAADAVEAETAHTPLESVPVIQYMQWGFDNPLAGRMGNDGPIRSHVFNARSESVDEKRMFSSLVHKKRCIVLVDGFYEWHTEYSPQTGEPSKKQGFFFHVQTKGQPTISLKKNGADAGESPFPPMYLAGLYDASVNDQTGETTYCCVVLTDRKSVV